jgi:triacylglycerol lipase
MNESIRRHPVILVPGWLDNIATMGKMADYLNDAGFQALLCSPQPSDGRAPIEELAAQLADFVAQALPDGERFHYIGFSMGGLIGRYYLQELGGRARMANLVTISTPHRGTYMANSLWLPAVRQMRPESDFIHQLNSDLTALAERRFVSIWTPLDLSVVPPSNSELPVGESRRVFGIAHALMPMNRRVWRAVEESL